MIFSLFISEVTYFEWSYQNGDLKYQIIKMGKTYKTSRKTGIEEIAIWSNILRAFYTILNPVHTC